MAVGEDRDLEAAETVILDPVTALDPIGAGETIGIQVPVVAVETQAVIAAKKLALGQTL